MKKVILFLTLIGTIWCYAYSQVQIGDDIYGESTGDLCGYSVSLSSDGSILALGAYGSDANGFNSGQVRVYTLENESWTLLGNAINGDEVEDNSGVSVALSSDGSILAVGAPGYDGNGNHSGQVRIFHYASGSWSQLGNDILGEKPEDWSGRSVALSANGLVVAIGAISNYGNGSYYGHVRVYSLDNGSWSQLGSDIVGESSNDNNGSEISLSSDGTVLAIAAINNSGNGNISGHVRVHKFDKGSWSQLGSDIDGESANDQSGTSISLSSDGSRLAIGAANNGGNGVGAGHVRVFHYMSGEWNQLGEDIEGKSAGEHFGSAVSLSSDGSILAAGNYGNGINTCKVRIYRFEDSSWTQLGVDIEGDSAGGSVTSVDLSSDGSTIAIGTPYIDWKNKQGAGLVRVFTIDQLISIKDIYSHSESLIVYPNPSSGKIYIAAKSGNSLEYYTRIYDYKGAVVKEYKFKNLSEIELKESGVYFIRISEGNGNFVMKKVVVY